MRRIWFHRNYQGFTGGHLKHSHYFNSVCLHPVFVPKIFFSDETNDKEQQRQMSSLWGNKNRALEWSPHSQDIIFLAGMDWSFVLAKGGLDSSIPIINLIQGTRHADSGQQLYQYLEKPAIRLCVSQPVADAIIATGKVNGPVSVIPNGVDCQPNPNLIPLYDGIKRVQIIGYKMPEFASVLAQQLCAAGVEVELLTLALSRKEFMERLDPGAVVVCCPLYREGFYLTALEAMAKGCLVVVPDCEGNRAYAIDEVNCFFPDYQFEAVYNAVLCALAIPISEAEKIRSAGMVTASKYTLENERVAFYGLLNNIDQLWQKI